MQMHCFVSIILVAAIHGSTFGQETATSLTERGNKRLEKKEYEKAITDFSEAIRLDPKFTPAYFGRANAWELKKECEKAVAGYRESLEVDSKYAYTYNNLAWLLATCPNDEVRDGKKAVEAATKACELREWKESELLDTLAAACAEAGDFDAAVKWDAKAILLARTAEEKARENSRLKLYQEKKAFRRSD
jgi:Tfp pilus assembly protein PilF